MLQESLEAGCVLKELVQAGRTRMERTFNHLKELVHPPPPPPHPLLVSISCPFISTRAQFTMHDSREYLTHIYELSFSWKAHIFVGARWHALTAMAATWSHIGDGACEFLSAH
jgi:hypothetical protein